MRTVDSAPRAVLSHITRQAFLLRHFLEHSKTTAQQGKHCKMRKRGSSTITAACALTAACCASTRTSAFFLAPPATTPALPRGVSLQSSSHATTCKTQFCTLSAFSRKAAVAEGGVLSGASRARPRGRSTRTSMIYGGGGGEGRGGRGPRGPFGFDSGTLATIGFALLVVFAPGVLFGAFNTLFLVRF